MGSMKEKKYLKWYNILGYGTGDVAANLANAFINMFILIYMTDTVGVSAGVIGVIILFAKCFDGFTDLFFGHFIDRTNTKMGKARPWMFFAQFGVSICVILMFSIPSSMSDTMKYAWFFLTYICEMSMFYTANNIAYSSLTALATKNSDERVLMGTVRFVFSIATNLFIAYVGVSLPAKIGYSRTAILFSIAAIIINTIAVFSVRELPEDELMDAKDSAVSGEAAAKPSLIESLKIVFTNKYFIMVLLSYLLFYIYYGTMSSGVYYFKYVMHDASLYSTYSSANLLPMIPGLIVTPILVKKFGMYKTNLAGYVFAIAASVLLMLGGMKGSFTIIMIAVVLRALGTSPLTGDQNALIAEASE
ncbi:MFS transporter, partial [Butyricicoccus sp.]|uniref:MFS transporter n=1 Tax=Butyricicoccus sp. TaxID=2049021 RepID=UPI003F176D68